jgi:inward rectifier potassium channel
MASRPRKTRRAAAKAATKAATAAAARPRFATITASRRDVVILGGEAGGFSDFYHWVLTIPWWDFFLILVGIYLGANIIFASLYMLDPGGVAGARPHSFADAFFFSVQTLSTIGYGVLTPKSLYANVVVTAEAFSGLGLVAVATGLIIARISRPTARMIFTRFAVITPVDGTPTLMFRAANQRGNQILEAQASLNMFHQITTAEGLEVRTFKELPLVRARQPMFVLTWLLMHRIDETSPLFGCTEASLQAEGAELVVTLNGVDEIFGQRIYARHSYLADEILFDRQLADVLTTDDDGRRVVNYYNFHEVTGAPDGASH